MAARTSAPVLIVGAGPAGLVAGCLLRGAGIDCAIFEHQRRAHVESRARAGFLAANTVRVLEENGLADGLNARAHRHTTCAFRGDGIDYFADCDGRHGVARRALPAAGARRYDRDHGNSWLAQRREGGQCN